MSLAIRNIAIIAHVDHGKTTLVDQLLRQSGTFRANQQVTERVMDSNDLERERGITILAKNCAVEYDGTRINIVDTPGHADFGGEVERALSMVDGVLLLVDAVEGPMPQTRFVTRKALALGLKPIVVVNKIDRPGRAPRLGRSARPSTCSTSSAPPRSSSTSRWSTRRRSTASRSTALKDLPEDGVDGPGDAASEGLSMKPLFEAILRQVPAREDDPDGPLQFQISALDYSSYVGKIGIGRINRGRVRSGQPVTVLFGDPSETGMAPITAKVNQVLSLPRTRTGASSIEAQAGDIVAINGIDADSTSARRSATRRSREALPLLKVDEPTMTMEFLVNTSPMAGREGKYVTSRQIRERLERELRVERGAAGRVHRRFRHLHRVGPRRAAPDDPAREHAARGLRAGGVPAQAAASASSTASARSRTSC